MSRGKEHYYISKLKQQVTDRKIDRREFLRTATLLGMSVSSAYAFVGDATGKRWSPRPRHRREEVV